MKTTHVLMIAGVALITACASAPKQIPILDQARSDVQTLQQDPRAAQDASQDLAAARSSLNTAEAAMKDGKRETVEHYAYLASRQAQIGEAHLAEVRAKEQVAKGEADRNRVLLDARTEEAESMAAKARMAEATEAMQRELAELQAKQTERGMVVTLGDVLFNTGAATLLPGADLALGRLAEALQKNPDMRVIVEGHTDSQGSDSYNEDLSRRRSQAVRDALVARGVAGDRIETIGRGEAFPVASNDSAEGRQQNRRVEIVFSNDAGQFATTDSTVLR